MFPTDINLNLQNLKFFSELYLYSKDMNLLLVFGLDVPVEGTRLAKRLVAMRTLISPFTTMDSFDMVLEVTSLRE